MDETLLLLIEKGAIAARSASDVEPAMPLFAVESHEGFDGQAQEIGDPPDFLRLKKDPSFSVTALPALLALKSLHWPQTHTDNTRHFYLSPHGDK
jgi:hypothetical protein